MQIENTRECLGTRLPSKTFEVPWSMHFLFVLPQPADTPECLRTHFHTRLLLSRHFPSPLLAQERFSRLHLSRRFPSSLLGRGRQSRLPLSCRFPSSLFGRGCQSRLPLAGSVGSIALRYVLDFVTLVITIGRWTRLLDATTLVCMSDLPRSLDFTTFVFERSSTSPWTQEPRLLLARRVGGLFLNSLLGCGIQSRFLLARRVVMSHTMSLQNPCLYECLRTRLAFEVPWSV